MNTYLTRLGVIILSKDEVLFLGSSERGGSLSEDEIFGAAFNSRNVWLSSQATHRPRPS